MTPIAKSIAYCGDVRKLSHE